MHKSAGMRLAVIIFFMTLVLGFPSSAQAQGIIYGDTVPAGVVVDHDVLLVGQNVSLAGTVNGNVLILANQVSISGVIDGSLILIGQNATIAGQVSGAVYGVSLTLEMARTAQLNRDLYIATVSVVSQSGSRIGRNLFALSLDAGLNGQIQGEPHTAIGPIQLYNGLMTILGFDELTIKLHIELPPPSGSQGGGAGVLRPAAMRQPAHARILPQQPQPFDWTQWAISQARDWIVLSVFGLLGLWLTRRRLEAAALPVMEHPWQTTGIGLVALVITFNLFILGLLLAVLVFCIGLGLNFLGLWQISIALWIASYATIAIALVALWFFVVYVTKLIVVDAILNRMLGNTAAERPWLKLVGLLAGLLIFVLLRSVPYVGWVFGVMVTAAGLGSAWLALRRTPAAAAMPQPTVPTITPEISTEPKRAVAAKAKA